MLCSQCGKNNEPGKKFCVQCGAPLPETFAEKQSKKIGYGNGSSDRLIKQEKYRNSLSRFFVNGLGRRKKILIIGILMLVLILIAGINISKIWFGSENINIANEYQMANNDRSIYETNSFIYFTTDEGVFRADKESKKASKLTNRALEIVSGSENSIYCNDSEGSIYAISDDEQEPEKIISNYNNISDKIFLKGRYVYQLSGGILVKSLNSGETIHGKKIIYEADPDESVEKAVLYGDHVFMEIFSNAHDTCKLIRVSLSDGKSETLEERIEDFALSEEVIVCLTQDGSLIRMDLNGKNAKEYTQADLDDITDVFCSGKYVYYYKSGGLYRINIDGSGASELKDLEDGHPEGIISGLAYLNTYRDELSVYNYDGKKIAEVVF